MSSGRLLIDWVYYPPVGHAIEAFRLAAEFEHADPGLHIGVLLNARAPLELAGCVPAVDECHGVELGMPFEELESPPDLSHVPT